MRRDGESKTYHENEEWLPIFSVEELYKSLEKNKIPKQKVQVLWQNYMIWYHNLWEGETAASQLGLHSMQFLQQEWPDYDYDHITHFES